MGAIKRAARMLGFRRSRIASARLACERAALRLDLRQRAKPDGRILCYHSVGQPEFGVNDVAPDQFRRHVELALAAGHRFVPPRTIADGRGSERDLAVTFDDAARSVLDVATPILRDHDVPFAVFVVAGWADERDESKRGPTLRWREIERLLEVGAEIGSHSMTHPNFGLIPDGRAQSELLQSRRVIEDRLNVRCDSFAAPYGVAGSWNAQSARLASEAGYAHVYAQSEELRPAGTVARSFVTCFDGDANFRALLRGAYDLWEEWS